MIFGDLRKDGKDQGVESNVDSTDRPSNNNGTAVACAASANTWGTGVLVHTTTGTVCNLTIRISAASPSGINTQRLVKICTDSAGNNVLIPNLMCYGAGLSYNAQIGYSFPIHIAYNTPLYAFHQSSASSSTSVYVWITATHWAGSSKLQQFGSYVDSFGVSTSTSTGTALTPGTTNNGAWTLIASNITKNYWWVQQGFAITGDTSTTTRSILVDSACGDGSNYKYLAMKERYYVVASVETLAEIPNAPFDYYKFVKSGSNLYMRAQDSGTLETAYAGGLYLLGG
jgi:hypothetical protein